MTREEKLRAAKIARARMQQSQLAAPEPTGQGYGNNLAQAVGDGMFMGFGDEISARLNAMTGYDANTGSYGNWGTTYDDQLGAVRQQEEQFSEQNPMTALGANVGGAVLPAALGIGAVVSAPTTAGRMIRGAQVGAAAGAVQGFGEGEGGVVNRANSGLVGAGMGAALGGAIPGVAEVGRQAYRGVEGALRDSRIGNQIGQSLGVSPSAGRFIGNSVGAEDTASMQEALRRAGPDAMLADASPAMARRLDATLNAPVAGAAEARDRINSRAGSAYYDIIDALDGGRQGPQLPPVAAQQQMRASARPAVNEAYSAAYSRPIDYSSPAGQQIEDVVSRLPAGPAQKAIQTATDRMIYDGAPSPQLMASIAEDGTVSFQQMPNVIQLDYLKRAFDEIAESGKDPLTGALSPDGAFASRIARDIREATAEAVPEYRTALSTAASDIRERGAVRTGATLLRPQTTVEQAATAISDATPAEIRAMRTGVRGQIDHVLGNVRAVSSDSNIEPRQAMQALRELSSPNAQRKMEALYGDEWPGIKQQIDRASAALGLRAGTSANSATASRLLADREITDEVTPGALRQGKPLEALKNFAGGITGASPEAIARSRDEVKSEIADLLTRQGGAPQQVINQVVQALMANPSNPAAGNGIRDVVTALGLTAVPGLTERLQRTLGTLP